MEDAPVIGYQGEHHAPPARPRGHRGIHIAAGLAGAATAGYGAYRVGRRGGWRHPLKRARTLMHGLGKRVFGHHGSGLARSVKRGTKLPSSASAGARMIERRVGTLSRYRKRLAKIRTGIGAFAKA